MVWYGSILLIPLSKLRGDCHFWVTILACFGSMPLTPMKWMKRGILPMGHFSGLVWINEVDPMKGIQRGAITVGPL